MSEEQAENELSSWMSTYGLVTAERILERYQIRLPHEELFMAVKNPNSFYYQLLKVPLKNVFNGIILQQAYDYQVYAQKMFVDYLMSGESAKPAESPGAFTREDIEKERQSLVGLGERFRDCEYDHKKLIAQSQKALMKLSQTWLTSLSATALKIKSKSIKRKEEELIRLINALLVHPDFTDQTDLNLNAEVWARLEKIHGESLAEGAKQAIADEVLKLKESNAKLDESVVEFSARTKEMGLVLRGWRTDFHDLILRVQGLLQILPDYRANQDQDKENRESLSFDTGIGE